MIILGGGVAGLAASMATGAPLYEAGETVGGVARSKKIDGFTFDYGIHVLQTQHETVQHMLSDVGVRLETRDRNAHIYSHETYTAYPFQVNTAGLPAGLRARCLWGYLRRDRTTKAENYEQWIYNNVGRGFGDTFLIPYSDKFWTVHPREMTCQWTNNRIPQPTTRQVLRGALISKQTRVGTNAVFEYPGHGDGYGTIPELMGRSLGALHLRHRATRIDAGARRIEFNDGAIAVSYETLVSTIPLPDLVRLIDDAPADVQAAASKLRCNSILVINLGLDRADVSDRTWVHFPEAAESFFRISYPHNLGPGMAPPGMSSVAAEVAYSDRRPVDRATIVERVTDDLIRIGSIPKDAPIVVRDVMDIKYGYVIYDMNRRDAIHTINEWLTSMSIHPAGRYGLWAYLWSHEAMLSGKQTAERVMRREHSDEAPQPEAQSPPQARHAPGTSASRFRSEAP